MSPNPREATGRWSRASAERAARDAARLANAFERAAGRVRRQRAARRSGAHITDTEAVHDMRVALRRLSSALRLWRPMLDRARRRAANRALRHVRRAFGPVREIEVHIAGLHALGAQPDAENAATRVSLTALDRNLCRRYASARSKALTTLKPRLPRRVRRDVERAFDEMRHGTASRRARAKVAARLRDACDAAHAAIRTACQPSLRPENEAFHLARIAIKKWRYATERSARVTGRAAGSLQRLRELQEALGKAHDAVTLGAEIARFTARSRVRKAALAPLSAALHAKARTNVERFRERAAKLGGANARRPRVKPRGTLLRIVKPVSSRKPSSRVAGSTRESSPGT